LKRHSFIVKGHLLNKKGNTINIAFNRTRSEGIFEKNHPTTFSSPDKNIVMIASNVVRKIASTYLYDRRTGMELKLPSPFQIAHYHHSAWNGGTANGSHYLHIERMSGGESAIPTILAEGDLDMFLVAVSSEKAIEGGMKGLEVAGAIGKQPVRGYIAAAPFQCGKAWYLVFVAADEGEFDGTPIEHALHIAGMITKQ
jgi:hypothetical protein